MYSWLSACIEIFCSINFVTLNLVAQFLKPPPFATYKRHYGLARNRFMGLAKNATIYGLAAIAANIRKGTKFLVLYGVSKPCYTG
ncbi:MAG: hypothetical protein QS721_03265 [Candidatus Endonucleobacter sp. (ex Gigantidas childressi)]|nr:hypothetical protein [Candidatus Endonucleobacter sp. (ex Gigantidas childressi)]